MRKCDKKLSNLPKWYIVNDAKGTNISMTLGRRHSISATEIPSLTPYDCWEGNM